MKRCSNCNFPNIDSDSICFKCGTALLEESPTLDELLAAQPNEPPQVDPILHPSQLTPANQTLPSDEATQINQTLHPSQPTQASQANQVKNKGNLDDLVVKPNPIFDANTNISDFIHKPTEVTEIHSNPKVTPSISKPLTSPKVPHINNNASSEVAATSIPLPTMPVPPLATSSPTLPTPARIVPKYKSLARLKVLSILTGILFGLALIAVGILLVFVYPGLLGVAICIGFSSLGVICMFLGFVLSALLGWLNDVECNQRKQVELINHIYHKLED